VIKDLQIREEISNTKMQVFGKSDYPVAVQKGIDNIMDIVQSNKTMPELYKKALKTTMVSTSMFQDLCVQMEEHHTPHRKLRQVMLELEGKLGALDTAKNGHKKTIIKIQTLENEINELNDLYNELSDGIIDFDIALRLSSIQYVTKNGEEMIINEILPKSIIDLTANGTEITNEKFINSILDKVKVAMGNKIVDHEEAQRQLKSAQHMVKDSAVKAHQLTEQAKIYEEEVDETGLTYDESEFTYYVMFFTAEAERQLRTGDHQIDRGTYKAISQTPTFVRNKILKNIDILINMIRENQNITTDYFFHTHKDLFLPKYNKDKDGNLWIEGMKVTDYLLIDMRIDNDTTTND
jgi:plasmid stabilization system protein ParE